MKGVGIALVVITLATTPTFSYGTARAEPALSLEEARAALCQPQYTWDCGWVVEKARRESTFRPQAINWDCDHSGRYVVRCYGFLQLEEGWAPNGDVVALLDLWTNIEIAHALYASEGKGPWGG